MDNSDEELEPEGVLHGRMVNNTLSDEDGGGSDATISPGSVHDVGLEITTDWTRKVVGGTIISKVVERGKADEMGGCPFSGLVGVEAPHPMQVGSSKVEAK